MTRHRTRSLRPRTPSDQAAKIPSSALIGRFTHIAPWTACLFIAMCVATVPYGAPVGHRAGLSIACAAGVMLGCTRLARTLWDRLELWPMIVLVCAYVLSSLVSVDSTRSIERFASMPLYALVFVAVQVAAATPSAFRMALTSAVLAALAIVIDAVLARWMATPLFHDGPTWLRSPVGSQSNANDLAAVGLLLPLAWIVLPLPGRSLWYGGLALVASLSWILSASRQTAIGWCIGATLPILMQMGWRRGTWIIAALLFVGALATTLEPVLRSRALHTLHAGLDGRTPLLVFGSWLWWQRPWLGHGPGTFGELYIAAVSTGWSWRTITLSPTGMPWVHNLPLEVLCDLGAMGGLAFVAVIASATARVRRLLQADDARRRIGVAVTAMAATVAVVGMVDLTFLKDWVRIIFWLGLGLAFVSGVPRSASGQASAHAKQGNS